MPGLPFKVSAEESYKVLRFLKNWARISPPSSQERLEELSSRIDRGQLHPSFVADKVGALIRESLMQMQGLMQQQQYEDFVKQLLRSLQTALGNLLRITKNLQINLLGLREIWLACEPMLDLVEGSQGWQDLLPKLIARDIIIRYFLYDTKYFDELVSLLESRGFDKESLKCLSVVPIDTPHSPPVSIWICDHRRIGMSGLYRPAIKKNDGGKFVLEKPLSDDWLAFLSSEKTDKFWIELRKYVTSS